ncbi:uncharacterized protein [Nicotiana tomentosiformis]|uniref:uncharacterized protein n=1 Tax=Nicotiana tomentosiformis TaxID=4098 RepID=UPI00388C8084
MEALRDGILAFKQEPNEPLHEIWERYRTMVKDCPNNDMTEAMIQQTFYRGVNMTNQRVVNQLDGGNFMKMPYANACDILDEMADTSSAWQGRLTKAQLQQVQGTKQVNAMEGVNVMVNKRRQRGQQVQNNQDQYEQNGSDYNQDDSYDDQSEELLYANNYQALNTRPKGALPSDTVVNPKGGNNTGHAMVVTTRSGRGGDANTSNPKKIVSDDVVLHEYDEIQSNDENVNDGVRIDIDDNMEETQNDVNPSRENVIDIPKMVVTKAKAPLPRPPPPYPQRLEKKNNENQFKKFIEMMKRLSINVPLVEALEQMPGYAKFMKYLVTKKRSMNCETIKMTHQVSAIVHSMALKLEDPGAFTISCTIGSAYFAKALCDLGASINLMPSSVFKTLGIGKPRATSMRLQMADRTMKKPLGIIDDVLVRVDKFILRADFVILDCKVNYEVIVNDTSAMINMEDPLEAVLLNHEDDEKEGLVDSTLAVLQRRKKEIGWTLANIRETNLVLNWEKCHFMVEEGTVLVNKISKNGIEVDKAKIEVILILPPPTPVKGIRSFIGHAGFYRRFIKDFSKVVNPLCKLLEKDAKFVYN